MFRSRVRCLIVAFVMSLVFAADLAVARDIHVDPVKGDDASETGPVKTIRQAIRMVKPGDTIHLLPIVYREYAGFYGVRGEPGKPITLDGHGATLEGSDPLNPEQWEEVEPGLFRSDKLLPNVDQAILGRWFFLWEGRMNHMGRTSKGKSAPLKKPDELESGEWTFVVDPDREPPKPTQLVGHFYLRLPAGQKLADAKIFVPVRSAGVQFSGNKPNHNAHLVIRNLTATHPYNDGFNIHGHCEDVLFENVRAIECGDDGISAHETAQYRVEGFVSIGNSTGICDTGASETSYNNVFIRDCLAFDLYFLDTGIYSVTNAVVLSSAARAVHVTGRAEGDRPCRLMLENVFVRRVTNSNEVRVSRYAELDANRVTLQGLHFQATSGSNVHLRKSLITSEPAVAKLPETYDYIAPTAVSRGPLVPEILLWPDVTWKADHNFFSISHLRHDKTIYLERDFAEYQKLTEQDIHSRWGVPQTGDDAAGADLEMLKKQVVPEEDLHLLGSFAGE